MPMLNPDRPGIQVRGSSMALQMVIPQLQRLVADIVVSEHPIDAPGMPQYFAQEKGEKQIHFVCDDLKAKHIHTRQ